MSNLEDDYKQRPIRFRAWDKKRKEWYGASSEDILTFYGFSLFGECTMFCMPPVEYLQHIEVIQSTGLKDKNGKEIYEGDIYNYFSYQDSPPTARRVVKWVETARYTGFNLSKGHSGNQLDRIEIIGNIWENPELLK